MVTTPGVANSCSAGDSPAALYLSGVSTRDSAFSVLAAYPQDSHEAIRSSPASVGTMNSVEPEPPIAPECASTCTVLIPQPPKMRTYACRCASNDLSTPARSRAKEQLSFMVNCRTRRSPDLGRSSSRNLVSIWYQLCGSLPYRRLLEGRREALRLAHIDSRRKACGRDARDGR